MKSVRQRFATHCLLESLEHRKVCEIQYERAEQYDTAPRWRNDSLGALRRRSVVGGQHDADALFLCLAIIEDKEIVAVRGKKGDGPIGMHYAARARRAAAGAAAC
jgi:hypothetical protein